MTHTSLDGQPLRGLWSALDSREETTTMTLTTHIPDPPVSWYGTPDDPGPVADIDGIAIHEHDHGGPRCAVTALPS